jgi:ribosomal protein S18 acetylase RimI-like enzyme
VGQISINQIHWPSEVGRLFLVVTRDQQHKGYGRRMIEEVEKVAVNAGLEKLWLMVRSDNLRGQAMYLRAGYLQEGLLRSEYRVGDVRYDMVRMAKLLIP